MVIHKPWEGLKYKEEGLDGQKIAIVGNSHYLPKGHRDKSLMSQQIIRKLIRGDEAIPFFTSLMHVFGYKEHGEFWPKVVFFNYVSECIGSASEKHRNPSPHQVRASKKRFQDILDEYQPDKVLIFSKKMWNKLPECEEEKGAPKKDAPLLNVTGDLRVFWKGTYKRRGGFSCAYGLRHPQGANGELLTRAVRYIVELPMPNRASAHHA